MGPSVEEDSRLDAGICRQAIVSRDPRFDGRFFAAATTTGLYCRNVCPIPFARPRNLVLFAHAAAAEAAGFRPCKRCRPQAVPGSPAWLGTSAVVSRGLRLIMEGALNEGNVEQLADRLGLGSRQLRRLFVQHLGASPIKIAAAHRVQLARKLIDESSLPASDVAFHSGFRSIREFNHAVRASTGRTPGELRRGVQPLKMPCGSGGLELRFRYRKPFDWKNLIAFLKARAVPGVEFVTESSYRRTIEAGGEPGFLSARFDDAGSCIVLHLEMSNYGPLPQVVERVRRIFDLDADPVRIDVHLSRDPALRHLIALRPGLRIPGTWDGFEAAVAGILGQTLSSPGPEPVMARLVQMFGECFHTPIHGTSYLFPRPEVLAKADLSKAGIGESCAASLRRLARSAIPHQLRSRAFRTLEEAVSQLSAVCGIQANTAHYIALRALGDPDAYPARPFAGGERWRPWRAYAAMHVAVSAACDISASRSDFR